MHLPPSNKIVIQKVISSSGLMSRRQAETAVRSGQVKVNGVKARLGDRVDLNKDVVKVKSKTIKPERQKIYYLVNKPVGYTCTLKDRYASKKIIDLVPSKPKVWPVGRLDKNSSGLIIMTNDGDFTHKMTHPSYNHQKEYIVTLNKNISPQLLNRLKGGIKLKQGIAKADSVKKISAKKLNIIIHQGWKRQIRLMLAGCGYQAVDLLRVRIQNYKLGGLKPGKYYSFKLKQPQKS